MSDKDKFYLGIDGGGTKTAFVVIDSNNNVVFKSNAGPASLDTVSLGETFDCFLDGVKGCPYLVDGIFAGIGGVSNDEQIDLIKEMLKKLPVCKPDTKIDAGNDVISALYGALGGEDGIIIIAGTGSVCYGLKDKKYARSGGYAYQEGDAGSSYDLGKQALSYLARVLDYRATDSSFADDLRKETGAIDYSSFAKYIVKASRTDIARLSKIVTKHEDEEHAKKIIINGVNEILLMIKSVYTQLEFNGETKFSIIGSLGNADSLYKRMLLEGIKEISKDIIYVPKKYEAYIGSALKAKEE